MNGIDKLQNLSAAERQNVMASLQLNQLSKDAANLGLESLANDAPGAMALVKKVPELKKLTINITAASQQTAVLFDLYGINGFSEGTVTKTVSGGVDYSDANEIIAYSNLLIVGFRLQVPSASSFGNTALFKRTNIDGSIDEQANLTQIIQAAQNPNYLQATFVYVPFTRVIDVFAGLSLVVDSGTTSITFYVAKQDRNS